MRIRPTVGLLVLDARQRVLLFKVQSPVAIDSARPAVTTWWGPPGGGLEGGETFEEAGVRELWEGTGLRVSSLGPWVATYERTVPFPDEAVRFHIRYFVVAVPTSAVDLSNLLAEERVIYRAHRWWTVAEIAQSDEVFLPPGLAELLRAIILGRLPSQPIVLR
jgi:ADP-ribose pyrophosphatase YjhB (NUDIX family)